MLAGTGIFYLFLKKFRHKLLETKNPLDKQPDLSEYYDTSRKAEIKHDDDFAGVFPMDKEESRRATNKRVYRWIDKHF
ncbi:hypothetical protein SAMN02910456_02157 [Ruminococcaceae bacterium YRB3002]|nr:hypothetical protein SAMN02910456_02157 [Ruminococcaceae bacterium YRB3002]